VEQRGVTLFEVVIVAAIFVLVMAAALVLSAGSGTLETRAATSQFDGALAYAQSLAATSGNGATLVFSSDEGGFTLTTYAGRPNAAGAMRQAPIAPFAANAHVSEAKLGPAPFTVFLNGEGHASGIKGAVSPGTVIANDPGCPSGESSIVLTFEDPHYSHTRTIPCKIVAAGMAVPIGTVAPDASAAPSSPPSPIPTASTPVQTPPTPTPASPPPSVTTVPSVAPSSATSPPSTPTPGPCKTQKCSMLYEASYTGSYYMQTGCVARNACIKFVRGFAVLVKQSTDYGNTWATTDGCASNSSPVTSPSSNLCTYGTNTYGPAASFTIPSAFFVNGTPDVVVYEDTYTAPATLKLYSGDCGPMQVTPSTFMTPPPAPSWTNPHACVNV
jgi:hypothetical protein